MRPPSFAVLAVTNIVHPVGESLVFAEIDRRRIGAGSQPRIRHGAGSPRGKGHRHRALLCAHSLLQPPWRLGAEVPELQLTEMIARFTLALLLFNRITIEQQEEVTSALRDAIQSDRAIATG